MMNGAGDGIEGGAGTGDAFVKEGEAAAVGVGMGVELEDAVGNGIEVETMG